MSSGLQPFHDNVVIVTGASTGIGEQLAYRLAAQGAHVVLAARSEHQLRQVAQACAARGVDTLVVPTDCTDESQYRRLANDPTPPDAPMIITLGSGCTFPASRRPCKAVSAEPGMAAASSFDS